MRIDIHSHIWDDEIRNVKGSAIIEGRITSTDGGVLKLIKDMDEAKQRALQFIKQTTIEGQDSSGGDILTNLEYLQNHLDQLLTF